MKRRDSRLRHREVPHQPVHPIPHLGSGFVGKGDGQDRLRRNPVIFDQVSNAMGDNSSLARSRSRQDQHWPVHGFNGLSLLDRKSTRLNSSHVSISYAVFCLKKKKKKKNIKIRQINQLTNSTML